MRRLSVLFSSLIYRWRRHRSWLYQENVFLDTEHGDDRNSGENKREPLRTMAEVARRAREHGPYCGDVVVHLLSDITDIDDFNNAATIPVPKSPSCLEFRGDKPDNSRTMIGQRLWRPGIDTEE